MHRLLTLGNSSIPVTIMRGKPHRIKLTFQDGRLVVFTGTGQLQPPDMDFIRQKSRWITRHYQQQGQSHQHRSWLASRLHSHALVFGRVVALHFELAPGSRFRLQGDVFHIYVPARYMGHQAAVAQAALRRMADNYLKRRTAELAAQTGLTPDRVVVKSHRSKWGSCSTLKNINLNWHLILLDKQVIDYVIIHELAHLREMNHGPNFWALVARHMPDYKTHLARLRQHQWVIGLYDGVGK